MDQSRLSSSTPVSGKTSKPPTPPAISSPNESFRSINQTLSTSCSSISSIISNESNCTTSSLDENEMALNIMLYNSFDIIPIKKRNKQFYFKFNGFMMADKNDEDMSATANNSEDNDDDLQQLTMMNEQQYPFQLAVMNDLEYKFQDQNTKGRSIQMNEFIIVRCRIPLNGNFGVRIDLFQKQKEENSSINDNIKNDDKIAFGYLYPININDSNGIFSVPITTKLGTIFANFKAEYFITKAYNGKKITIESSPKRYKSKIKNVKSWELKKHGYDIGHRGAGCARRFDSHGKVLENTIDSFNFAYKKGADMVELDVQLSKDKIPIVYHDFNVEIVLQQKDKLPETFPIDIKNLTYEQLQKLHLKPLKKNYEFDYDFDSNNHNSHSEDPNNNHNYHHHNSLPFASLQRVLKSVEPECGFNVEIKYPQKKINGDWEAEKSHDLNEYVDIILQDLFLYGEDRKIIISSFHPEICSMVKLKQDRYPVLFLTQGLTTKWMQYHNPLNHSIKMAVYLALSMELYGVAVHAEDIINDKQLIHFVKSKSLVLFCWGDDLNDRELIKKLKQEGIDGAIYDKIDLLIAKTENL